MKLILFLLLIPGFSYVHAQIATYHITRQDTIELAPLNFKRTVALHLEEAIVLFEYGFFMEKIAGERRGLQKQIRSRERMIRKGSDYGSITASQLKGYQRQYPAVDSIYRVLKTGKPDTVHVDYNVFVKAQSPFGDFLPRALEAKQCMVMDAKHVLQRYVIKQSGNKKTGSMTAAGSRFYFLEGATRYFWSKMDWVS